MMLKFRFDNSLLIFYVLVQIIQQQEEYSHNFKWLCLKSFSPKCNLESQICNIQIGIVR